MHLRPLRRHRATSVNSKLALVIWLCSIAATILVAGLAISSLTPIQSGPGALTVFPNIPKYAVLFLCLLAGIACVVFRPRPPRS